ncbi:MAG: hypothetical protein JWN18_67 [Parcubacteria group bacterium]|nr:hypothetical protein [Parcubacteria group bacterium]
MKTPLIVLAVLVVLGAGYLIFTNNGSSTDTPNSGAQQGKLNIDAVCDGALAYMTFPDGASAQAFVAECKEGKHPEVIEKYKADNNLGDGKQI